MFTDTAAIGQILLGADLRSFTAGSRGEEICYNMDKYFQLTVEGMILKPWDKYYITSLYKRWLKQHLHSQQQVHEIISQYGYQTREDNSHTFFHQLSMEENIDEKEAVLFAVELLIAGVESTGNALSFLIHHLGTNPDVQQKLHEEITTNLSDVHEPSMTLEKYRGMSYLHACVKESLRLTPPTTGVSRITSKNVTLSGCNIRSGTCVITAGDYISTNDKIFNEPLRFKPERWLRSSNSISVQPFSHIPFGHGARMCIGRRFAEQELTLAAMTLVRSFYIESVGEKMIRSKWKVFYTPNNEIKLFLTTRPETITPNNA